MAVKCSRDMVERQKAIVKQILLKISWTSFLEIFEKIFENFLKFIR